MHSEFFLPENFIEKFIYFLQDFAGEQDNLMS